MSFIIGKACIGVKDSACIAACPVDCIHTGEEQMYIDPEECINCGACVPECPVKAIFEDEGGKKRIERMEARKQSLRKHFTDSRGMEEHDQE